MTNKEIYKIIHICQRYDEVKPTSWQFYGNTKMFYVRIYKKSGVMVELPFDTKEEMDPKIFMELIRITEGKE